tara:strand:+ start:638 stop:844 length:207 start_codon:yes stop_codon:yes gene_type:complete
MINSTKEWDFMDEKESIAVIDMSTSTLDILSVPTGWGFEETEEFLMEQGYHLSNCSWGAFNGEINDKR